ncbi:MAG: hypothetical protein M3N14_07790 [Bacteroidota bacterium]|nr:hypothetical protein [Bacteroidota bacterium]
MIKFRIKHHKQTTEVTNGIDEHPIVIDEHVRVTGTGVCHEILAVRVFLCD